MEASERHMSRRIEVVHPEGKVDVYPLSIVEIRGARYEISPFSEEVAGVIYHDRPLRLTLLPSGKITIEEINC